MKQWIPSKRKKNNIALRYRVVELLQTCFVDGATIGKDLLASYVASRKVPFFPPESVNIHRNDRALMIELIVSCFAMHGKRGVCVYFLR